ncbi:hypothetical protein Rostov6_00051 [Vibrio phage Rostov 6]|uniref:DUF6242 domain-containing protein n=1 Tax=Vibrio phage Rostov 6 TaxID=2116688 RepID=A0A2S1GN28_9CAUD|nr:hypothetical protein Rostov6_00051 [Vibrio phage Rostov 6]
MAVYIQGQEVLNIVVHVPNSAPTDLGEFRMAEQLAAKQPQITAQPVGGSIYDSQTLGLSIAANVFGSTAAYQWLVDGAPIQGANSTSFTFVPSGLGTFDVTCEIKAFGPMVTSEVASVTVEQTPVDLTWQVLPAGYGLPSNVSGLVGLNAIGSDGSLVVGATGMEGMRSTDKGLTWSYIGNGFGTGQTSGNIIAICVVGNVVVVGGIAGSNIGVASRSTNGGVSWTKLPDFLNSGATASAINKILHVGGNKLIALLGNGYAAVSNDLGATWSALPRWLNSGGSDNNTSFFDGAVTATGAIIAVGQNGFASISRNGGVTWSALPRYLGMPTNTTIVAIGVSNTAIVVGGNNGNCAISRNDGVTWSALPLNFGVPIGSGIRDRSIAGASNGTFLVGLSGSPISGNNGYLALSYDDGVTWQQPPRYLGIPNAGYGALVSTIANIDILTFLVGFTDKRGVRAVR